MIKDYAMVNTENPVYVSFLKQIESSQQLGSKGQSHCSGQQIIEAVEVYSAAFSASVKPEFAGWKHFLEVIAGSARWLTSGQVWNDSEFSCFLAYQSAGWIQLVELSDWQGGRRKPDKPNDKDMPWYMGRGFIYIAGFFSHLPQFLMRNRLAPLLWNEITDEKSFCGYPAMQEKTRNAAPILRFAWWRNCLDELAKRIKNKIYGKRWTKDDHYVHFGSIAFFPCVLKDARGATCLRQFLVMLDMHERKCSELKRKNPHRVRVHTDGCLLMEPTIPFRHKRKGVIGICICRDEPCLKEWEESYGKKTMRDIDDKYRNRVKAKAIKCPADRDWMDLEKCVRKNFDEYMRNKKGYGEWWKWWFNPPGQNKRPKPVEEEKEEKEEA